MRFSLLPEPVPSRADEPGTLSESIEAAELSAAALRSSPQLQDALARLRSARPTTERFVLQLNETEMASIYLVRKDRVLEVRNPLLVFDDGTKAVLHIGR